MNIEEYKTKIKNSRSFGAESLLSAIETIPAVAIFVKQSLRLEASQTDKIALLREACGHFQRGHMAQGEMLLARAVNILRHSDEMSSVVPEKPEPSSIGIDPGTKFRLDGDGRMVEESQPESDAEFPEADFANEGIEQMKLGVATDSAYIRGARKAWKAASARAQGEIASGKRFADDWKQNYLREWGKHKQTQKELAAIKSENERLVKALEKLSKGNRAPGVLEIARQALAERKGKL